IVPIGTMGQRREEDVKWHLILENEDGSKNDRALTVIDHDSKWSEVVFLYFDHQGNGTFTRSIPVIEVTCADGSTKLVATIYDVMLSEYGVKRDGATYVAESYDDASSIYTPAWQEPITSVKP